MTTHVYNLTILEAGWSGYRHFYLFCDKIQDIDYEFAIKKLMLFFTEMAENLSKNISEAISCQVIHWLSSQPTYRKMQEIYVADLRKRLGEEDSYKL